MRPTTNTDRHSRVYKTISANPGQIAAEYFNKVGDEFSYSSFSGSLKYLEQNNKVRAQIKMSLLSGRKQKHYSPVDKPDDHIATDIFERWSDAWLLTQSWTKGNILGD